MIGAAINMKFSYASWRYSVTLILPRMDFTPLETATNGVMAAVDFSCAKNEHGLQAGKGAVEQLQTLMRPWRKKNATGCLPKQ